MSTRPMKIGLILPDTEHQMNGETARWSDFAAMARAAEEIGADSLWVTDHLIHRAEIDAEAKDVGGDLRALEGPWECWSLLTALAAVTERVEIGSLVLCASFRNPALLAKMADTLDEISGGRLLLGLGAGWNRSEYDAFGYPFDHRVDRFEEAIQITLPLLRTGRVDFEGRYCQAKDCMLIPRGPRAGGPPIFFGTSSPRMLSLTARYADGWNVWFSQTQNDLENLKALLRVVDAACKEEQRDPATLFRSTAMKIEVGPHQPSAMSAPGIAGTPDQLARILSDYADAGIDHAMVWLEPNTVAGIEAFGEVLRLVDAG